MNRRELLRMIAIATGGVMVGGEFLVSGCKNPDAGPAMSFSEEDITLLEEIAETILPQTTTAGAKAAGVGRFMTVWVNDCYTKEDQDSFHKGLASLNEASEKKNGKSFLKAGADERKALLVELDKEAKDHAKKKAEFDMQQAGLEKAAKEKGETNFKRATMPAHYFQLMKQLTIYGYFTSEKGRNEGLRYVPVPGKYETIDYKKGDKLFAGLG